MEKDVKVIEVGENDECVAIALPYTSNMTVYGNNGISFNSPRLGYVTENKYLTDDRRKTWEDSDQPMRRRKLPFGKSRLYVNQLLDFNVPYVIVREGNLCQLTAVKVDNKSYVIAEEPKLKYVGSTIHWPNEVWSKVATISGKGKNSITISGDGRILNLDVTREEADKSLFVYLNLLALRDCSYHFALDKGVIVPDDNVDNLLIPDTIFGLTKPVVILHPESNPTELNRLSFKKAGICDDFIIIRNEGFRVKEYTQDQAEDLLSRVDIKKSKKVPVLTKKGLNRPFWKIENN